MIKTLLISCDKIIVITMDEMGFLIVCEKVGRTQKLNVKTLNQSDHIVVSV